MKFSQQQITLLIAAAAFVVIILIGGSVRGCGCTPEPTPIVLGIDAGPGDDVIEQRLDGAVAAGAVRIEQIEQKFQDDMDAFDVRQRQEYERRRAASLEDAARYLSDWSRHRQVPQ